MEKATDLPQVADKLYCFINIRIGQKLGGFHHYVSSMSDQYF
jgi:hypothetical protein